MPQVTSWAMRSESDVTRDMIHPTGVLLKYENDRSCRWLNIFRAQVILDPLAQHAGQVDEAQHRRGLHEGSASRR